MATHRAIAFAFKVHRKGAPQGYLSPRPRSLRGAKTQGFRKEKPVLPRVLFFFAFPLILRAFAVGGMLQMQSPGGNTEP